MNRPCHMFVFIVVGGVLAAGMSHAADAPADQGSLFATKVAPILERHCVRCHNDEEHKGGLSLSTFDSLQKGGDSGPTLIPRDPGESRLVQYVEGDSPEMPKNAPSLMPEQRASLREWIKEGAKWPLTVKLKDRQFEGKAWWSLQTLFRPAIPEISSDKSELPDRAAAWTASPIDAFIFAKLVENQLAPSTVADRRTLIRRLSFDLHGLPPDPADVDEFMADHDPTAYERLVDRLLASPRYGERWARHWLDVVHYGDTHGYDKDKPRPNAWPFRDYVIRSLNEDKPYDRFIQEQLAGDILWPDTVDGITGTGFIAAGPWDFIGHAEVPESKIDGKIARNLDRDDMVTTSMNAFCSMTVQCARCHNHKFDPVTQIDYYRMQAVFAALDRADRTFDDDPVVGRRRMELLTEQKRLKAEEQRLTAEITRLGGDELKELDKQIASTEQAATGPRRPEYGYHSGIEPKQEIAKWVQVDLGLPVKLTRIAYVGCWDDFNNIGAGFGFPVRFKIEAANDASFQSDVVMLVDQTQSDLPNPGTAMQQVSLPDVTVRYVRVTATKLAPRQNDFIFALAELSVFDGSGNNVSSNAVVTALDSIEAPVRWGKRNLVDGIYASQVAFDLNRLREQRTALIERLVPIAIRDELQRRQSDMKEIHGRIASLPAPHYVYAGMIHLGGGTFSGTGPFGGKPRTIRVLKRGDVTSPGDEVGPGHVPLSADDSGEFQLPQDHPEGDRRIAFARWITDDNHPLTWRSIANRVWQYHFGRGIVDSPNDFGRMGQRPTHPELLDWLASEFRGSAEQKPEIAEQQSRSLSFAPRSLKHLHRHILISATYRQASSNSDPDSSIPQSAVRSPHSIDSSNLLYWRANRRKLDAESLRDSIIYVAGKLDDRMGGPAFQDFVIEKPEHSPHYEYRLHDAEDPRAHRRSVYRFLVRSQTQPFMTTLDCADPSMIVDKRNETVTALQALALLNNKLVLSMSRHMASRIDAASSDADLQIIQAYRLALSRMPNPEELHALTDYARQFGLAQACRVILNLNEFAFVD